MNITRSLLLAIILLPQLLFADPLQQRVTIEQATVFLTGAELFSTAKVTLPKGESEVLFTNVAGNIVAQSLSVGAGNDVIVQSATPQNNYLANEAITPRAQLLKDSITMLTEDKMLLNDKLAIANEQIEVLRANRKVTGDEKSLPVAELQKMLELFKTQMNALLAEKHAADKAIAKVTERIALLQRQLEEEMKKEYQPGGQVLVKFFSEKAVTTDITLSYVVPDAGWTPSYDLRVEKINTPVKLFYKANVHQNSGVKWSNVKLVLSTGNPNEGAEAPSLTPWHLSFYAPVLNTEAYSNSIQLNRQFNTASAYKEDLSIGGARTSGTMYLVDGVQTKSLDKYVRVDNSGINTSFDIDLAYTIPSDGQPHIVAIKDHELPATYRYFAVPKLDRDAFLQARITNWENLDLLPAQTNIFYEGTYVGQGFIDMRNVKDTMNISLGRDKKIVIRREKNKDYHATKTIGTNTRQSYTYTVSVRNTRQQPVELMLMDQFPVSNDKEIVIEDTKAANAQVDETTGAVKWLVTVKPNEMHTEQLSYTVKYPKDRSIGNLY